MVEEDANGNVLALNGFGPEGWSERFTPTSTTSGYLDMYSYDPQGSRVQRMRFTITEPPADEISNVYSIVDTSVYDGFGAWLG